MIALVQGIVKARCVNLTLISAAFEGDAKNQSTYRRFQRFFRHFDLPIADVARAILSKIPKPADGHVLCMDHTNWQLGKRHINILTVGIRVLLMDREFLGEEWLGGLDDRQIALVLPIKKNTLVSGVPVAVMAIFSWSATAIAGKKLLSFTGCGGGSSSCSAI